MTSGQQRAMFIFGFAGFSGSGKTTLAEKLIARAKSEGIAIASIKHAHHNFDPDQEGKDSWRHRKAGAEQVIVASERCMAHFTQMPEPKRPALRDLLARLSPCDWVLVEGFKKDAILKLEIYDSAVSQEPLYHNDRNIIAVISQSQLADCPLPQFHRDDVEAIFAFLCAQDGAREQGS